MALVPRLSREGRSDLPFEAFGLTVAILDLEVPAGWSILA